MIKFKKNIFRIFVFVTFFLISGNSIAQQFVDRFKLDLSIGAVYDDNLLKNSEKYIELFLNNEDQGRFHINTYDDVFVKGNLRASYYFKFIKKFKTKLSGSILVNTYTNNSVKNWKLYSIGLQQYFSKKGSFKFYYSYIPNFYVRHFRDDDLVSIYGYESNTFAPYEFEKDSYSFWIQNTFLKNTKIRLNLGKASYFHNEFFTEYDANNLSIGMKITQPISKKLRFSIAYLNTVSEAKGFDEPAENIENSDEADASYSEHKFDTGIYFKLPRIFKRKNSLEFKGRYSERLFSTSHLIHLDPLHSKRVDANISLLVNYKISLTKESKLSIFYNKISRNSYNDSGIYDVLLSEEKDYKQNQIGFKISYSIF